MHEMKDINVVNTLAKQASWRHDKTCPPMTDHEVKLKKQLEQLRERYYEEKEYQERALADMEKYARRVQYKWEKLRVHCWAAWSIVAALIATHFLR